MVKVNHYWSVLFYFGTSFYPKNIHRVIIFFMDPLLKYKIGIGMIPHVGSITAKKLIAYTGSVEGIFKENRKTLEKIPGIGPFLSKNITQKGLLDDAEKEIAFINKYNIKVYFYLDSDYPARLKNCCDAPLILYAKGDASFNPEKVVSIVGTRKATQTGLDECNKLIDNLAAHHPDVTIVSGLAYGIDVCAHKGALHNNLPTVAVLGHGLNTIYPAVHRNIAKKISDHGALLTEFTSGDTIDRNNFIKRNRIIAGISDATIVVESALNGGALITADIANSYDRDVFAYPGRVTDEYSKGCNRLIKINKAVMIESINDLEYHLGWDMKKQNRPLQQKLFKELTEEEKKITTILDKEKEITIDMLCIKLDMPASYLSTMLLGLEFNGIIKSLPGKVYKLR
jgi:DNA processing protein